MIHDVNVFLINWGLPIWW